MAKITDIKEKKNILTENIAIDEATSQIIINYKAKAQKALNDADSLIKLVCQTYLNAKGVKGQYHLNEDGTELVKDGVEPNSSS